MASVTEFTPSNVEDNLITSSTSNSISVLKNVFVIFIFLIKFHHSSPRKYPARLDKSTLLSVSLRGTAGTPFLFAL